MTMSNLFLYVRTTDRLMSDSNETNSNVTEDLELGIDNNSSETELTTNERRRTKLVDTTGLDNASAILNAITSLHQIAEVNKKNEVRKLREMTYNATSLDLTKKRKFMKYLEEVPLSIKKEADSGKPTRNTKPEIIKYIFEHNEIKSAKDGFSLTTMAMAWLEYYNLKDSITLDKMKKRIHSMIFSATKFYGASIYGTPITKFKYLYYITTDPDDYKKQSSKCKETSDLFESIATRRNSLGEQLQKEIEEEKAKAKEKQQVIEVDDSGHQTTNSSNMVEPEPASDTNENAQEGEESETE